MSALRHIFSDKDQELLEAARCGKNETIEKLLRKRQTSGTNLLPSFLKSVNVNCVDREGNTPLHHAALNGHKSTVEILVRENASINVIDNRGCSPLHLASWNGHSDICLIFLTNQPELSIVNLQNGTGDTALHNASQFGHAATVEVLLQNFADPAIRNLKDESPLDLAARYGRLEVVQCLLNKYPELVRSSILNHSPLHLAAACGHKQIVELLLDLKYEINTKTDNGTALHVAAVYCKTEIAKLLLERGIDCCEVDKDGLTVLQLLQLHEKTQTSYVEVIKAIREHMALLESQKKMSATSAETEAEETPVYDTLVEHVKPKPKPRLSVGMKSEDLEKGDVSSLYSKPIKDISKGPTGVSPQKSPTPPVPPRQSSINMLDGETSPLLRSISEVSNERDSANITEKTEDSSVTTDNSVPLLAETKAVPRPRLPPKTRSLDDRRAVSMIDLPKPSKRLLPPEKSPVRIHSTNSKSTKSLNEELPAPCLGQEKAFSYLDMSDNSGLLSKPQAKPTKPPRLKKSLSPTIERHKIQAMPKETETAESKKLPTKSDQNERTEYEVMSQVPLKQPHSPTIDTYSITVTRASLESEIKGDNSSEDVKAANDGSEYYNLLEAVERESSGFTPSCVSPLTKTVDKSCNNGASIFAEYSNVSQVEKEKGGDGATPVQNEGDSPPGGVSAEKGSTLLAESRQEPQRSSKAAAVVSSESDASDTENSKDKQSNEHSKGSESNVRDSFYDNTDADLHVRTLSEQSQQSSDNAYSSTKHDIPDQVSAQKGDNCDRLICDTTSKSVSEEAEEDVGVDKRSSDRSGLSKDEGVRLSNGVGEDHPIEAPGNEEENYDEGETKIAKPPSLEFHKRRSLKDTYPLTPTGYVQPPTPDFPPPSPQTAIQGIHEKIAVIDPRNKNKRTSQDMETITDANLIKESGSVNIPTEDQTTDIPNTEHVATGNDSNTHIPTEESKEETEVKDDEVKGDEVKVVIEGEEEVVKMRRSSKRESTSSVDDLVTDDSLGPFAGLLRGSVIYPPKKNNENAAFPQATNRKSLPTGLTFDTVKEEDMATIAMTNQEKPLSGMTQDNHDNQFDDSEEWAKIENIMASFGAGITRESVFVREFEPNFTKQLAKDTSQIQSIGDWLERIDLGQYENTLIANGFDDTDFLSEAVMDENDLQSIGITLPEHRKKILAAAKSMPQITPIDPDNPPSSLEEWLSSLHLLDLKDTFYTHKYETMDRVLKLWELELTSVLDISAIGHRKRILASLKNRPPADKRFPSLKRRTKDATDESTPFKDVNLYKDYTKVKPLASSEEDIKNAVPSPGPPLDSSEEEEVFRKDSQGKAIRDSTIHLRPPHLAHTTSPIRQWRHRPEMLIKGCCNYTAQYLGSTLVRELSGTESTIEGIAKLKKSADLIAKIPTIMLSISYKGVKFIDAKSKKVICDHEIGNIFCACQDAENMNFFAYITRDNQTGKHYCHVFSVRVAAKTVDLAREIILTLGEAFEVAYQMALKERAGSEATEFERQLSQSDHDDTTSISSKASVNTV